MFKIIFILLMLIALTFSADAQEEEPIVYQIKAVYPNADLNEKAIERFKNNIELRSEKDEIMKLFKPIKGKYRVFLFMASSYGLNFMNKKEIFHNFLILKVDKSNEILDGLEYILEWAEPPHTARFVRVMKKGIKLQKGLNIQLLDFRTFETDFRENYKFGDFNGILDNLHDLKEVF